ncbi:putative membrane bound cation transporter [Aspergillus ibericus CBS 121593]|uniref:Membrane bound cation transporter n=1 Tax=Aspergillus ibericus CBS 121593 TaxID=1448316 RepID=A0A395GN80_9EURO|nr:membrane bound cation transporter [Aspergillus ibericus CBS 121593]RAK96939.1 membrane bound cation transporter [Aspergillus ibericus CBS 121593]
MHRIHSWAKAHASTPNTQSQGPNQANNQSSEDASAQDGQVKEAIRDPASPESEKNAKETPNPGLIVRMKNGIVRFTGHTKRALCHSWVNVLLVFVPVGIAVEAAGLNPGLIFAMNAIAIIPLAGLLSHATECVASRLGDTVGALINVTFGNAVELIIFIIALVKNEIRIVQASLLGSILANLLLILGMAFLLGGLRFQEQIYNSTVTQMSACLLSLSVMSLLLPTAFHASWSDETDADKYTLKVSRGTSVVLLLVYILYIVFQLKSHAYLYASIPQQIIDEESHPGVLAEFMNSSSDSSSSSDESVDTTTSWSTAKRIKRAMKYRRHRKSSTSSRGTVSPQSFRKKSLADCPPTAVIDENGGSVADLSVTHQDGSGSFVIDFGDDTRYDADHEPQSRDFGQHAGAKASKEERKKRRERRKQEKRTEKEKAAVSITNTPFTGRPPMKSHKSEPTVDRGQPPLPVEEAIEPAKRKSAFRPMMPSLLTNTVFSSSPAPNAAVPASPSNPYGLRRTHSLPSFTNRPPPPGSAVQFARGASRLPTAVTNTTAEVAPENPEPEMSRTAAVVLLLVSTGLVAVCAEFLVDAIPTMVESSSVSEAFIGLIILPIVGNAAEHVTAVSVATKNKMDLAIGVSVGSSIQIAIFVTPLVVILGWCMDKDMSLYFTLFETICLFVTAFVVNFLVLDGRSNYLEGSLLIAAYVIISVAAFYYPDSGQSSTTAGA